MLQENLTNIIIISFVMPMGLSVFFNWFFLYNIKKRIQQIGGNFTYENRPDGFYAQLSVPLDLLPKDTEIKN